MYRKYKKQLSIIRSKMKTNHNYGEPQFDDIEAELTALFLLYLKPKNVIEFSPCTGWSTSIILDTLEINNNNSKLTSYDLLDKCSKFVRKLNHKNVTWDLKLGDVTKEFNKWNLEDIDYLFIDSDHSAEFALKFINNLLTPLLDICKKSNKEVLVSVHDVFHTHDPGGFDSEGPEVIEFLAKNNIPYYTASQARNNNNFNILKKIKKELGFDDLIHPNEINPAIFFLLK